MIVERMLQIALLGSEWVMDLLLALSVVSFAAMVERVWFFRRHRSGSEDLGRDLVALYRAGEGAGVEKLLAGDTSVQASVLAKSMHWLAGGPEAFMDALDGELGRAKRELERGMNLLGTLGNNAPFIGLLGTVIGVIEAFHQLGAGQSKAAMGNVMSGIAEALVATGIGLFVAIPAVVAYNAFQRKVEAIEEETASIAKQLCAVARARAQGYSPQAREARAHAQPATGMNADAGVGAAPQAELV